MSRKYTNILKMENRNKESEKPRETVTLVLKVERFEVEKQKLIDKNKYFAALLSANYRDHLQTEHVINFDILPITLQDFIDWIQNDDIDVTATNDENDNEKCDRLLNLLKLSDLFAADNLAEFVIDKLETNYLSPKYVINIWLLSQEFNINMLRDLSLAICLDRFDELPLSSIYELSKENLVKLIGNINVRSTESYLSHIAQEWMKHHNDFTIRLEIILEKKEIKILHSIISCESQDVINNEQFIHCWDGNDFFELTSFKYPKDITDRSIGKKVLSGMQIATRRYDLYLCGGEFGIGTGKFNTNVWRYSLISKKWYLETVMPVERRHMITVFSENKLVLMGGVGRHRQKLHSVDIYDIYTGEWMLKCTNIPSEFVSVPEHFVLDGKVIIYKQMTTLYIYFPDENVWDTKLDLGPLLDTTSALMLKPMPCYIDIEPHFDANNLILRTVMEAYHKDYPDNAHFSHSICYEINCRCHRLHMKCHARFTMLYSTEPTDNLDPMYKGVVIVCANFKTKPEMLHFKDIPIRSQNKFCSFLYPFSFNCHSFFNLIHPANLHTTNFDHICL